MERFLAGVELAIYVIVITALVALVSCGAVNKSKEVRHDDSVSPSRP